MRRLSIGLLILICLFCVIFIENSFAQPGEDAEPQSSIEASTQANDFGPIENSRQLFSALEMTDEQFSKFHDGRLLDENEFEPLLQSLHALLQFPTAKIHEWTKRNVLSSQLNGSPEESRGELFHFEGRLKRVTRVEPPAKLAERFDIALLYRCEIELQDGGRAEVFTKVVPDGWKLGESIDENVSFDGAFLKVARMQSEAPQELIFVTKRVAWHPPTNLGNLGLDVGLLENVAQNRSILGEEAEAFYQTLAAVGRVGLNELLAATRGERWTVIPAKSDDPRVAAILAKLKQQNPSLRFYFAEGPEKYVDDLMAFEGQVYRCVPVKIANREVSERLGFDQYYDLTVFIDLEYELNLGPLKPGVAEKDQAEGRRSVPTQVDTYPISACVRQLPPGFPTGDKLKERVRIPGYFFKQWAYRSTSAAALHSRRGERSPLIIGPGVEWLSRPKPADSKTPILVAGAFAILFVLLCFVIWRTSRRDQKFRQEFLTKRMDTTSIGPQE